jgi:uncharacterized membrane protein YphA (DoxX/SURF4 family)
MSKINAFYNRINLADIGRIFYGLAITEVGAQLIYYHSFPYVLPLPEHVRLPLIQVSAYLFGGLFVLAGLCIVIKKMARQASFLLAGVLLLVFCCYYIPYEFWSHSYRHFEEWENAEKELALAAGALVIAGCFPENAHLKKLAPAGAILFAIPIICFGCLHFLEAEAASPLVPSWIPYHLFWMYFCGAALIGSGISIILKIRTGLFAALLGIMIFIWFVILHLPGVFVSPAVYLADEMVSAFLALAYSGTAFVIASVSKKRLKIQRDRPVIR